jgi:predicted O-linked N-acetylglucosamine transferase (SPINDLY family)
VAGSLLNSIGLPELITQNLDAYEAKALALATNPDKLLSLRERLAANRGIYPLFDTALFTSHIEAAYRAMWDRQQAGLAPEHIYVQAVPASS